MQNPNDDSYDPGPRRSWLTTPLSTYAIPRWLVYTLGVVGLVYLANPTLGVFELLPDNLPFIGNLDEGVATLLIWSSLVEIFEGRKIRRQGTRPPQPPEARGEGG